MFKNTLPLISLLLLGGAASADQGAHKGYTIHDLYMQCTSTDLAVSRAYCAGYIDGVGNAMTAAETITAGKNLNLGWCAEPGVTTEQAVQVFKNWHDKHPEFWNKPKELGVIAALQESWPCKN
jgi:hypothetical protein